jgi:hypothetical protein
VITSDIEVSMTVSTEVDSSSQGTTFLPTLSIIAYGTNDINDRLSVSEVLSSDYVNSTLMSVHIAATPQIESTYPGSSGNSGTMIFFSDASQTDASEFLF